jgi:hypothetical protein
MIREKTSVLGKNDNLLISQNVNKELFLFAEGWSPQREGIKLSLREADEKFVFLSVLGEGGYQCTLIGC